MINAILRHKTGTEIKENEDALTSTVFGLLFLLPNEILWKIIGNEDMQHNVNPDEVYQTEFWPRWKTGNKNYVEPDVFIETKNFNVIVEAKLDDNKNKQDTDQWKRELIAYQSNFRNEYKGRTVYFLALGGKLDEQQKELKKLNGITILKLSWSSLLTNVQQQIMFINDSNNVSSKVLERLSIGMGIFGYYNYYYFDTWEKQYSLSNYDLAIKHLNRPKTR